MNENEYIYAQQVAYLNIASNALSEVLPTFLQKMDAEKFKQLRASVSDVYLNELKAIGPLLNDVTDEEEEDPENPY